VGFSISDLCGRIQAMVLVRCYSFVLLLFFAQGCFGEQGSSQGLVLFDEANWPELNCKMFLEKRQDCYLNLYHDESTRRMQLVESFSPQHLLLVYYVRRVNATRHARSQCLKLDVLFDERCVAVKQLPLGRKEHASPIAEMRLVWGNDPEDSSVQWPCVIKKFPYIEGCAPSLKKYSGKWHVIYGEEAVACLAPVVFDMGHGTMCLGLGKNSHVFSDLPFQRGYFFKGQDEAFFDLPIDFLKAHGSVRTSMRVVENCYTFHKVLAIVGAQKRLAQLELDVSGRALRALTYRVGMRHLILQPVTSVVHPLRERALLEGYVCQEGRLDERVRKFTVGVSISMNVLDDKLNQVELGLFLERHEPFGLYQRCMIETWLIASELLHHRMLPEPYIVGEKMGVRMRLAEGINVDCALVEEKRKGLFRFDQVNRREDTPLLNIDFAPYLCANQLFYAIRGVDLPKLSLSVLEMCASKAIYMRDAFDTWGRCRELNKFFFAEGNTCVSLEYFLRKECTGYQMVLIASIVQVGRCERFPVEATVHVSDRDVRNHKFAESHECRNGVDTYCMKLTPWLSLLVVRPRINRIHFLLESLLCQRDWFVFGQDNEGIYLFPSELTPQHAWRSTEVFFGENFCVRQSVFFEPFEEQWRCVDCVRCIQGLNRYICMENISYAYRKICLVQCEPVCRGGARDQILFKYECFVESFNRHCVLSIGVVVWRALLKQLEHHNASPEEMVIVNAGNRFEVTDRAPDRTIESIVGPHKNIGASGDSIYFEFPEGRIVWIRPVYQHGQLLTWIFGEGQEETALFDLRSTFDALIEQQAP